MDIAQVFIIKSDYRLGGADYDRILKWMKNMLHEGNSLKDNFYATKFMMKPLGLRYKKKKNIQTFTCCTMVNIQILQSAKLISMLDINQKMVEERHLLHTKK